MNRGLNFLFAFLALLIVVGCGGGGHPAAKSQGTGVLSVTLDGIAGNEDGPTGTTETVSIYRNDGTEVDKKSVNLSSGTQQVNFSSIPSGTMRLHVGLSATAGGVESGAVDLAFEGGTAAVPVKIRIKQRVTGVAVSPVAGTVNVGSTTRFYAAARAGDGSYVPTAASGWSWTSDATITATVDATGTVSGVATGNANITATHVATGASAASTVSALPTGTYQGKWTIMVYMDAANSLWSYAAPNINQMEQIANNPNVRFVIQWKQVQGIPSDNTDPAFSGTRRYLAAYDSTGTIKSSLVQNLGSGVDMGAPSALRDFVSWSKAKYPADHYALVLWSHGNGWYSTKALTLSLKKRAIIRDDETGNELSFPDLRSALDPNSLDILAYDACLMQGAESLIEFADRTRYIVGSEDSTPAAGFPYQLMFKPFVDAPDTPTSALATGMATTFVSTYDGRTDQADWPIQVSVLDTSKASSVANALDSLGSELINAGASTGTTVQGVRRASYRIQPDVGYYFYDLDQIALGFASTSTNTGIQAAASAVDTAIKAATLTNATAKQGLTAAPNYHGMAIEFGRSAVINGGYATGYNRLQISALTHWNEFLQSTTANP